MSLIIKAIDSIGKFRADVIACKIENSTRVNDVKLQQYENAIKKMETKDRVERLELEIKYQNKLKRKAFLYNLISIVGTIGSIALTLCGITGSSFSELLSTSKNITYSILIIFTQFAVWAISANKHYIKNKFYNNYSKLKFLQICVIFTSMTCNYLFLISFLKPESTLKHLFLILMAISIDLISLTFCALAQDCKYRNYSYKYDKNLKEDVGIIEMIGFIMSYKLRTKLKNKYIKQLNEYQSTFEFTKELEQKASDAYYTLPKKDIPVAETVDLTNSTETNIISENTKEKQLPDKTNTVTKKDTKLPLNNVNKSSINKTVTTNNVTAPKSTSTPTNSKKEVLPPKNVETQRNNISSRHDVLSKHDNIKNHTFSKDSLQSSANIVNFTKHKNTPLKGYGVYENVKKTLATLDDNSILSASKLAINPSEWKKIKERLVREDLAYEQNSRIRKKSNISSLNKVNNS